MNDPTYVLSPISKSQAETLRAVGGPVYVADEMPGYPCRLCLQDAAIGDELILVSFDPFTSASPYRSSSPIFLHRSPCKPLAADGELPAQLTRRLLSVRSFDQTEMMIDATVIDGHALDDTITDYFENPDAAKIHIHNAERGCWAVTVDRPHRRLVSA